MLHGMEIRARHEADVDAATAFLERHNSLRVARMGRLERPLDYPALVAVDPKMVGLLTYIVNAPTAEIPTLQVDRQWGGIGTQLLQGAKRLARGAVAGGSGSSPPMTTSMPSGYQRRGFRLAQLHAGAVARSRASLKPEIPEVGLHGIPIRDELILETHL